MSEENQKRKITAEELEKRIIKKVGHVNNQWSEMSNLSALVFHHCADNRFDTSLVKRMYLELYKTDWTTLRNCFKNAAFDILGVTITHEIKDKKAIIRAKIDKTQRASAAPKFKDNMDKLTNTESEGLRAWKASKKGTTGGKKNGKVLQGIAIVTHDIEALDKEWAEMDSKSMDLAKFRDDIEAVLTKHKRVFDTLKTAHAKLAQGNLVKESDNDSEDVEEEDNAPLLEDVA